MNKLNFAARAAKIVKLNFDIVVKVFTLEKNICGVYGDDATIGYTTYYGFTAQGRHFSKKTYSHYPLKLVADKTTLDLGNLDYLKHIPPQVGDYIAFTVRANKKQTVATWCHSTLQLRRLHYALNSGAELPNDTPLSSGYLKPLDNALVALFSPLRSPNSSIFSVCGFRDANTDDFEII